MTRITFSFLFVCFVSSSFLLYAQDNIQVVENESEDEAELFKNPEEILAEMLFQSFDDGWNEEKIRTEVKYFKKKLRDFEEQYEEDHGRVFCLHFKDIGKRLKKKFKKNKNSYNDYFFSDSLWLRFFLEYAYKKAHEIKGDIEENQNHKHYRRAEYLFSYCIDLAKNNDNKVDKNHFLDYSGAKAGSRRRKIIKNFGDISNEDLQNVIAKNRTNFIADL